MLEVVDLQVGYGTSRPCSGLFQSPRRVIMAILGPNGAGKSTILRTSLGC